MVKGGRGKKKLEEVCDIGCHTARSYVMLADWIKGARWWIEKLTFHIILGQPCPSLSLFSILHHENPLSVERDASNWWVSNILPSFSLHVSLPRVRLLSSVLLFQPLASVYYSCLLSSSLFHFLTSCAHPRAIPATPSPCHWQRRSRSLDIGVRSPSSE